MQHIDTYQPLCIIYAMKIPNSQTTREQLLTVAFELFHEKGFMATGVNDIVAVSGLTKGAIYHHFKDKSALLSAVIEEVIRPRLLNYFEHLPVPQSINQLIQQRTLLDELMLKKGCPFNNLLQEMSTHDETIRLLLLALLADWHRLLVRAFTNWQQQELWQPKHDIEALAWSFIAQWEGCVGLAKSHLSGEQLSNCLDTGWQLMYS